VRHPILISNHSQPNLLRETFRLNDIKFYGLLLLWIIFIFIVILTFTVLLRCGNVLRIRPPTESPERVVWINILNLQWKVLWVQIRGVGGMCGYHGRKLLCGWFAHWLCPPIILLLDICTNIDKYRVLTISEYNISPSIIYIGYWLLTISLG